MKNPIARRIMGLTAILMCLAWLPPTLTAGNDGNTGASVYKETCIACHGANGKGVVPGAPDFTKTGGVLSKSDQELANNIINGLQSPGSPMAMPPKGGNLSLTKDEVMDVIGYMRKKFLQ